MGALCHHEKSSLVGMLDSFNPSLASHLTGMDKSYYVCTLPGQVQKGSVKARKDFKDKAKLQFALEEETQYKKQSSASGRQTQLPSSRSKQLASWGWMSAKPWKQSQSQAQRKHSKVHTRRLSS